MLSPIRVFSLFALTATAASAQPSYVYKFDAATAGGVDGSIQVKYAGDNSTTATITAALDFSGVSQSDLAAFAESFNDTCSQAVTSYTWHIHTKWNSTQSSDSYAKCNKAATDNHYDPDHACGPVSEYIALPECKAKSASYACNPANYTADPTVCEKGDLSGKVGKITPGEGSKVTQEWTDEHYPLPSENTESWSIVLHAVCENEAYRFSCAVGTKEDGEVQQSSPTQVEQNSPTQGAVAPGCGMQRVQKEINEVEASVEEADQKVYDLRTAHQFTTCTLHISTNQTWGPMHTYVYKFDAATAGGVDGSIQVKYAGDNSTTATITAALDFSGVDQAKIAAFDGNCTEDVTSYKWHIHTKWNSTQSSDSFKQCSKAATGNHYDPDHACGSASEYIDLPECKAKSKSYACSPSNYTSDPTVCEKGDLSGKFGAFKLGEGASVSEEWTDEHYPLPSENTDSWSIVLHAVCGKEAPRISCAVGAKSDGQVEQNDPTQVEQNDVQATVSPDCGVKMD
ncbi:hypothetical protein JM16_002764 [Phytophthora kernoviae]|uniref:Uncharacterized protein n=1 Tax=Phytophthora kernoviae TaxID=325452 RepID=A0A8T0M1T7_9STRA|nr:hypothetical protein JM16_002764 [Phytophthora kernoviae]